MRSPDRIFLLLLIVCWPALSLAETITVISNADAGPGTLRDAIIQANANGTGETDYIYFNLPGTTTADMTILLNSNLPSLSSNIIIDATTQPVNTFSPAGSKIFLHRQVTQYEQGYYAFHIENASQVEIYGFIMKRTSAGNYGYGISISGVSSDIVIGAPGKGNVINGFTECINTSPTELVSGLTIQSNILGLDESGVLATSLLFCYRPVNINKVFNLKIGGDQPDMGNIIMGRNYSVTIVCDGGDVLVSHNMIGTDILGADYNGLFVAPETLSIEGNIDNPTGEVLIKDNLLTGRSITILQLHTLSNGFKLLHNKMGTDVSGQTVMGSRSQGITIVNCGPSMIGGSDADKNILAGCSDWAISLGNSHNVTISRNELFCNAFAYEARHHNVSLGWGFPDNRPKPFVHVKSCNGTSISGDATPGAKLEVFASYRCDATQRCEGRNYIETIYAGADGKWTYDLNGEEGVFLTATDAYGATSEYSQPSWMYDRLYKIVHTACGQSTGGLKNVEILNSALFYWENEAGDIVSRDTSLSGVPAGKYRLVMHSGGCTKPECTIYMQYIEVEDRSPSINSSQVNIQPSTCGNRNGNISGLLTQGIHLKYSWRNAANIEISNELSAWNIGPGKYTFILTDTVHGCSVTAGPFEVSNLSGPELDVSGLNIGSATCGRSEGSIRGLRVSGSGTISYTWINAEQEVVGTDAELLNVPAGKYLLKFSDGSSCSVSESDTFEIEAPGKIAVDVSGLFVQPSGCSSNTGSLTGIQTVNVESIRWIDESADVVGTDIDLINFPAGKYTLQVSNLIGCATSMSFSIPQAVPEPITIAGLDVRHPVCNLKNGSITNIKFSNGTPVSFRWMDQNGQEVADTRDMFDASDGIYTLYVKDALQCEQRVITIELKTPDLPMINTDRAVVINDECNLGSGRIQAVQVTGVMPMEYRWLQANNVVSGILQPEGLRSGTYVLEVKDPNGCTSISDPIQVGNIDIPLPAPSVPDLVIIRGSTALIKVQPPDEGIYRLYSPGADIPLTSTTGEFSLPGITNTTVFYMDRQLGDCFSERIPVKVETIDAVKVMAPNAFSPNGDGINDIFRPKALGLATFGHLSIFDRWGNRIFYTQDPLTGWNGYSAGQKALPGTYAWFLQGTDINKMPFLQHGFVTIIY